MSTKAKPPFLSVEFFHDLLREANGVKAPKECSYSAIHREAEAMAAIVKRRLEGEEKP